MHVEVGEVREESVGATKERKGGEGFDGGLRKLRSKDGEYVSRREHS